MPLPLSILLGTEVIEKDWYNTWRSPGFLWVVLGFAVVLTIIAVGWTVEHRHQVKRRGGGGPRKKDPKNAAKGDEDEGGGDDAPPNDD